MAKSGTEPQIISTSTILILSGFIIGMTLGRFAGSDLTPYLFMTGVTGFMAFILLDLTSLRRSQVAMKVEQQQIEGRLDKHMSSLTSIGFNLEPISSKEIEAQSPTSGSKSAVEVRA